MGESSFDVIAALSKKKEEMQVQIKEAAKETPSAEMTDSADVEEFRGVFSSDPATEEDKKRFDAVSGPKLVDLSEEERRKVQLSGLRILHDQMSPLPRGEEATSETARTAEKVLFLSRTPQGRDRAARALVTAHLLFAVRRRDTAKDPIACNLGDIPDTIAALRKRKDALPELGDTQTRNVNLIVFLVMLAAMAAVLFVPAIAGLFTEENVYNALMAIGVIAVIAAFFIAGFGGSAAVLVIYALLVAGLEAILPMAILGKALVLLVLGCIGVFAFRKYAKEAKKLSPALQRRRADELSALRTDVDRCIRYINGLEAQVDTYLPELASQQNDSVADEDTTGLDSTEKYIRQYKEKLRSQRGTLNCLLPTR